jgi:arylsulfatase A-like enzyme
MLPEPAPNGVIIPISGSPTAQLDPAPTRLTPLSVVALSAWCGLVAGLLEVAALVVRKSAFDVNRLYGMTRHFVWLIPLTDCGLFLALGLVLAGIVAWRPRRGTWLAARLLCALTLLPAALVAFPKIYGLAWLLVMLGVAARLVPALERRAVGFRGLVRLSFPILAGIVAMLAASLWVSDRARESSERARPMPPPGAPNILLIVLDTVAAGHLDLYGYGRPTSPTLGELARAGIRFDAARSASSWTLPSHAAMFTGRWPHELSVGWVSPLDRRYPTLAEYLGSRGYATAGFVANTLYCATDSGLSRGFTSYHDYIFPRLTAFRPAVLIDRTVAGLQEIESFLENQLDIDLLRPAVRRLWLLFNGHRKDAATVNREFLDWLSRRDQPDRPFFAFLNDYDAHWPYELPGLSIHRFGMPPRDARESDLIQDWWQLDKRRLTDQQVAFARDAYDDCVAHLDEQLGRLIDELGRQGLRDHTWVIVLADHGESFGEHAEVFCHGTSLYRTELHVPLLVLPPTSRGDLAGLRIAETVSLRDLAATIVDLAGLGSGSPFPGESLARFWNDSTQGRSAPAATDPAAITRALSEVVPEDPLNRDHDRPIEPRWPLAALSDGDWTYIRREGNVREELFHMPDDPMESRNRAADPTTRPLLERMRSALERLTNGPLTPQRFNP